METASLILFAESVREPVAIVDARDGNILWAGSRYRETLRSNGIPVNAKIRVDASRPVPEAALSGWRGGLDAAPWTWDGREVLTVVLRKCGDRGAGQVARTERGVPEPETGGTAPDPVNYDFPKLLEDVSSLASRLAAEKSLPFSFDCGGELPWCLFGDGARLRQALLSLLSGVIESARDGGVALKVECLADSIRFRVGGAGMKPASLGPLPDPAGQAVSMPGRNGRDAGPDVSVCKSLIESMDGTVKIESECECGRDVAVVVTVPKVSGDDASLAPTAASAAGNSASARILVAGNGGAASLLKDLYGLDCDASGLGGETIDKVAANDYQLVLMDNMAPGMDGARTAARVRRLGGKAARVPIVALTADADADARRALISGVADDFLPKTALKAGVEEILARWLPREAFPEIRRPESSEEERSSPFLKRVREIDGVDAAAGLDAMGGDIGTFEQSLRLMAKKIPNAARIMEELRGAGNLRELCIHVHGMKSSLASIGAKRLAGRAQRLEQAAGRCEGEYCEAALPDFLGELAALGEGLEALFPSDPHAGGTGGAPFAEAVPEPPAAPDPLVRSAANEGPEGSAGRDFGNGGNCPSSGTRDRAASAVTEARPRPSILVIDDDAAAIDSVISGLKEDCGIHPFTSGEAALKYLAGRDADLILLDRRMPGLSGFRFLEILRRDERLRGIPVVFLTGDADADAEAEALEMGAVEYLRKPISPRLLRIRVRLQLGLHEYDRRVRAMVEEKTRSLNLAYATLRTREEITLGLLARVTDMRDHETGDHIERTTGIVRIIVHDLLANPAPDYTLTTYQADDIIKSAKLHDLGKIAMPDHILLKPGKLTPEEFEIIKLHPIHGERLLSQFAHPMEDSFLDTARDIAHAHHEKWDGSGYPSGLRGRAIPLGARIVAVADVYDALMSRRPYKEACDRRESLAIIAEGGGRHFDPYLAAVFLRHADEVAALYGEDA